MSGPVDLKEFVAGFLVEAEEYLESINRNLLSASEALNLGKSNPKAVRELFRSLHTIKGLASMVGVEPIVAISHEMEGILRQADRAGGELSENTLDLLVKGTRAIEERIDTVAKKGISQVMPAAPHLIDALALAQNSSVKSAASSPVEFVLPAALDKSLTASDREQARQALADGRRLMLIEFQPSPDKAAQGFNITSVRERLSALGELIKVIPISCSQAPTGIVFSLLLATDAMSADLSVATASKVEEIVNNSYLIPEQELAFIEPLHLEESADWTPSDNSSIRVEVRRLDDVLERLGDLVVIRSKLTRAVARLAGQGADVREVQAVLSENTRQLKRLRTSITQARMVRLSELLQRLPLLLRGLTKDTGKSVILKMEVGLVEVDKAVADKIFPAVVHLVRNSVDHAVESKEERKLAGKPEEATLTLICDDSSGTNLILTLSDDGRGIDRMAVAKKTGKPPAKDDAELLLQIATPGLSTRGEATTTSGRGMGMDIVKRSVELLGGRLEMKTSEGTGTSFTLQVPVSVTIVDVLSFIAGQQTYVVPVAMVDEILEIDFAQMVKTPGSETTSNDTYLLQRRGEAIPFLPLNEVLKTPSFGQSNRALVVNQRRGGTIAFGVDQMLGQQEVVVRPLDDAMIRLPGTSGATDLGDGRPTLVLDLATMGAAINKNTMVKL